jgi:hypothetical protein
MLAGVANALYTLRLSCHEYDSYLKRILKESIEMPVEASNTVCVLGK